MKQIKCIIVSCFAIICVALFGSVFTSCSNDDDLLLAGDTQTELVLTLNQDSVKGMTRGVMVTPIGSGSVSRTEVVRNENGLVYFEFVPDPSYLAMLTSGIPFYIKIQKAGEVGPDYVEMDASSSRYYKYYTFTENGLYTISYAYKLGYQKYLASNQTWDIIVVNSDNDPNHNGSWWCTNWVKEMLSEQWGVTCSGYGNATLWLGALSNLGYSYDLNPQVGDVAYWYQTNSPNGNLGHVAFVIKVINANQVEISEYNGSNSMSHGTRNLYRNPGPNQSGFPTQFIHTQRKLD